MTPENDEILEALRPRMRKARIGHMRRVIAGVALVPLMGVGAAAVAATGTDTPSLEIASNGAVDGDSGDDTPDAALPDIGEASGDEAETPTTTTVKEEEAEEPGDQTKVLSLGPVGTAEIVETEGGFDLLHTDLAEGWTVENVETDGDKIVIIIRKGDDLKVVTIIAGLRDEVEVRVEDLIIPTTTTTIKEAPVSDSFVMEIPGKGSWRVHRDGDVLWISDIAPNEGYEYDVIVGEGWKVEILFANAEGNWFAKAFINEAGAIEQRFWDEIPAAAAVPEPIYQWVEIPGVGAAKFKLYDGLIYVKELAPGACCGAYDYNNGQPNEIGKVDFEGDGILWIIDVWSNEAGNELLWSVTDMSPEPAAEGEGEGVPQA